MNQTENKLNLGCGKDYRDGYINADVATGLRLDVSFNAIDGIPYPDNFFGEVLTSNMICQIEKNADFVKVMNEIWRVCSGKVFLRVPNAMNVCAFQDPMDCRRFTPESFTYMDANHRRYDQYGKHYGFPPFTILKIDDNGRQIEFILKPLKI